MPEHWTGDVVGKMHVNCISNDELASKLGYTKEYVSMILNGHRNPKNAEQTFQRALNELIQKKQTR